MPRKGKKDSEPQRPTWAENDSPIMKAARNSNARAAAAGDRPTRRMDTKSGERLKELRATAGDSKSLLKRAADSVKSVVGRRSSRKASAAAAPAVGADGSDAESPTRSSDASSVSGPLQRGTDEAADAGRKPSL